MGAVRLAPLPAAVESLRERIAAAATTSHVLIVANPGVGVTMAVRRIAATWPAPTGFAARWEGGVIQWWSQGGHYASAGARERAACGLPPRAPWRPQQWTDGAPVRMPHHTVSCAGLLGGGSPVRPGECTLAHGGVLFLDEMAEFSRLCTEGLREPLDTGEITFVTARQIVTLPARFRLIASALPCPCGMLGHPERACVCSSGSVARYRSRLAKLAARDDVTTVDLTATFRIQ